MALVSQGPAEALASVPAEVLDAGAGVAIAVCSVDGHLREANALFVELTGLRRETLARTTLADLIAEENDPVAIQAFLTAVGVGQVHAAEFLCHGPGTTRFWCDAVTVPRAEHERMINLRDVSTRRAASAALRESPAHDRLLLERVQAGIVIHKANTEILYANAKATELLGVTHQTVLGAVNTDPRWSFIREDGTLMPVDDYPVGRAVKTGEIVRNLMLGLRRDSDGKEVWILCNAYPVTGAGGEVTEVVVSFTDVTKMKQAKQALKRSEERLQLILKGSSDAPWDNDFERGEVYYSPRWFDMLGYTPDDLPQSHDAWSRVVHPDDRERVERSLKAWFDDPTVSHYEIEFRFVHKAGHAVQVLSRAVILRDAQGRLRRVAGTNSDITERRALELRLRQSQKMEAIGQLAGGVAHDFNNLLAVISGNLELLSSGDVDPAEASELLRDALAATERGARLTRRLLAFSRQERLEPQVVAVADALNGVASILRRVISATITIDVVCPTDVPPILVDAGLLENALLNLAINARDAMPEGGTLRLDASRVSQRQLTAPSDSETGLAAGEYVAIRVRDSGHGMSDEVLAHATEPFYTTKPVGHGTGLGLAMVYGFARQSGGEMTIHSVVHQGTTVTLTLPVAPVATAATRCAPLGPDLSQQHARPEQVLLVEDDASVRQTCLRVLQRMGFSVQAAPDGPSALRMAGSMDRLDLLITDVIMPGGMSGQDLASTIRSGRPDLPVVFMSGYHADMLDMVSQRDDFHLLQKPFTFAALQDLVNRITAKP